MKTKLPLLLSAALLLAGGFVAVPVPTGLAQDRLGQDSAPAAAFDMDTIQTDMEVMRRVVNKRVLGLRLASQSNTSALTALFSASGGAAGSGAELFYVRGGGVTLRLDLPFPVKRPEAAPDETDAEEKKPSLWDDVLADVEGRPSPKGGTVIAKLFDPERLETFERQMLDTLALYGGRLRGVPDGEFLTVIVKGRSSARIVSSRKLEGGVYEYRIRDGEREIVRTSEGPMSRVLGAGPTSVLTYRVAFRDLRAASSGGITKEQLRSRITEYRY